MPDDDFGQVEMAADSATLLFERQLDHSPERVWEALTDSDELRAWYMADATIDGRPGGTVEMTTGPAAFHWTGRILAWEPFRLFEYEWNADAHPHLPMGERSIVRYELTPHAGGTLLKFRHSRLSHPTAIGFAPGTHALLDRLAARLDGTQLPNWMQRYDAVKARYPSWIGTRG